MLTVCVGKTVLVVITFSGLEVRQIRRDVVTRRIQAPLPGIEQHKQNT
jgi:hypothetical protein